MQKLLSRVVLGLYLFSFFTPLAIAAAPPPPTCVITVSPSAINIGDSVTLQWNSSNAAGGSISDVGTVDPSGEVHLLPSSATQTTYTGIFTGPGGTASCAATVSVSAGSSGGSGGGGATGSSNTPTSPPPYTPPTTYTGTSYTPGTGYTGTQFTTPTPYSGTFPSAPSVPSVSSNGSTGAGQPLTNYLVPCGTASGSNYGSNSTNDNVAINATNCNLCDLGQLIQNIISFLILISIPLSAGLFAWAGILYFTSAENEGQITKAKEIFKNVVIGFIIAVCGYLVIQTILNALVNQTNYPNWSLFSLSCADPSHTNPNARPRNNSITDILSSLSAVNTGNNGLTSVQTPTSNAGCGPTGCTASGNGSTVVYTNPDGTQETNTGGTIAWRNNNPGNMIAGAGGITPVGYNGGFAVFASYQDGYNAMIANLQTPQYQSQTIAGAIATWAPAGQGNNDPVGYAQFISQQTGLPSNTPMSSLTQTQLQSMANAIQQREGYSPGVTTSNTKS